MYICSVYVHYVCINFHVHCKKKFNLSCKNFGKVFQIGKFTLKPKIVFKNGRLIVLMLLKICPVLKHFRLTTLETLLHPKIWDRNMNLLFL